MKSLILKGSLLITLCLFSASTLHLGEQRFVKRDDDERQCLIEALSHEARNQGRQGQKAVLDVIHNRKNSKLFPNTYCEIVHQQKQFSYRNHLKPGVFLQYSFKNPTDVAAKQRIENLVDFFLQGEYTPVLSPKVLWYTKTNIRTAWMHNMKTEVIIGSHKFLKKG